MGTLNIVFLIYSSNDLSFGIHYELRFFDSIESWPEWDTKPRPRAYRAHALTTELSVLNGLQDQVTTKLKPSLGDCSGRVRIIFIANFLHFLYFHRPSEQIILILLYNLYQKECSI